MRDELLQATIEHLSSGLIAFDAVRDEQDSIIEFKATYVNKVAERMLQVRCDERGERAARRVGRR